MDKGVVEWSKDVCHAKHKFSLRHLWSKLDILLLYLLTLPLSHTVRVVDHRDACKQSRDFREAVYHFVYEQLPTHTNIEYVQVLGDYNTVKHSTPQRHFVSSPYFPHFMSSLR